MVWTQLTENDYCTVCGLFQPNSIPPIPDVPWLQGRICGREGCTIRANSPHKYCCNNCCRSQQGALLPHLHHRRCSGEEFVQICPHIEINNEHCGSVFFITFGVRNPGSAWLLEWFSQWSTNAHYNIWHQMQKVYFRRTTLRSWGHWPEAQKEFLRVHRDLAEANIEKTLWLVDWYMRMGIVCFAIPIACSAGHHRSCAHAEVSKQRCNNIFPNMRVSLFHLDGQHDWWPHVYDNPALSLVSLALSDRVPNVPHDDYFQEFQRAYHASLQNPPPYLLHCNDG
jgi:hypothetical protein